MQLKDLALNFKGAIKLSGCGRTPRNGMSYTDREIFVARFYCRIALQAAGLLQAEPLTQEELNQNNDLVVVFETVAKMNNGFKDIAHAVRASYRDYERIQIGDPETLSDWPKYDGLGERCIRDASSINVLFRKAIKGLVDDKTRNEIFKPN